MSIDYVPLLKFCEGVDISYSERYLQRELMNQLPHPAFSISLTDRVLGQFIPHIGYAWFVGDVRIFSSLIYNEERFLHTRCISDPEIFDRLAGLRFHGNKQQYEQIYRWWKPLLEGEAIAFQFINSINKPYFNTILAYIKEREPLHVYVATKLIEIKNLLESLKKRKSEVTLRARKSYEEINNLFELLKEETSVFNIHEMMMNLLRWFMYNVNGELNLLEVLELLIEELSYIVKAEMNEVVRFLRSYFADIKLYLNKEVIRTIHTLDLVQLCLEGATNENKRKAMRVLLCKLDAMPILRILGKEEKIFFIDPIISWLMNTPVKSALIFHHCSLDETFKLIHIINQYLRSLEEECSEFAPEKLQKEGFIDAAFYSKMERIRLHYARAFLPKLTSPKLDEKNYGGILLKCGMRLIGVIADIIDDLNIAYKTKPKKDKNQRREKDILIDFLKDPTPEIRDNEILFNASKNAAQLLEGFDQIRVRRDLNSLLTDIVTDYEFAETLIIQQIEPVLQDLLGSIKEFELVPYIIY